MDSEAPRPPGSGDIPAEWLAEFEAAARRPLATRFRYAFIHTYKPVLDDAPFRAFDTTADYRRWCEENLPDWLGYGRPSTSTSSSRRTASSVSRTPGGAA